MTCFDAVSRANMSQPCREDPRVAQPQQQETWTLKITTAGILALCVCRAPHVPSAQTRQWTDKGYVSVSGGAQAGSHDLSESGSFPLYDETATFTSTNKIKGGALFDIGGAYRVWGKNLLAGV